ncbi:MAG: ATP-binding protein [Polyangiales bacterium]
MNRATRATRDAIAAAVLVGVGGALCVFLDTAEWLSANVLRWESIQLDDLLLASILAICATTWFALRRWREARRLLDAQAASEREKALYVAKLEELSGELLRSEQTERARIAELLHDDVGQTLYACRLQLEHARSRTADAALQAVLTEAYELAGNAMASTRDLSSQISPPILHDLGLADAVEWLLTRTEQSFGVTAELVGGDAWREVHERLHEPVFQSVRELIANAIKHARARTLRVSAVRASDGGITIDVHDDGQGFVVERGNRSGFGLFSVERRMAHLGAQLQIVSLPGRGTCASLRLPAA